MSLRRGHFRKAKDDANELETGGGEDGGAADMQRLVWPKGGP